MSELVRYFLRLGFLGFGGPVALVGQMQRELVDEKGWLKDAYSDDGLHPNVEGYRVMAPIVASAIQRTLP